MVISMKALALYENLTVRMMPGINNITEEEEDAEVFRSKSNFEITYS
jgi:hypothetical protein